ncbi:hypothetical protein ACFWP5_03070 [Streptomyces sp. NPDC058469]|uniref:hypothetical protein n=1 Tax=Streptomyces sp. NPDC058469 TaxID=3346514 RepID=UPI0036558841
MALALGALLASGATMTLAAPAVAATGDVKCPSTDCVRIAPAAGSPVAIAIAIASDNAGAVYLAYSGGDPLKLDLASGALDTVTTGLGNLRGVAVADGSAYITSFDGTLQQVTLATGSRRTVAAERVRSIEGLRVADASVVPSSCRRPPTRRSLPSPNERLTS